jgi:hypothetical protein
MVNKFLLTLLLISCTSQAEVTSSSEQPLVSYGEDVWVSLATGNTNDFVLTDYHNNYVFIPNASGTSVLTGIYNIAAPGDGFWIRNGSTTLPLVLGHNNAGSDEYNRLTLPYGQDFSLPPGRSVWVQFYTHSGTSLGWALTLEPGMYGVTSTSVPTRSLGTSWQNTTGRPVLGLYSVRITTSLSLTTGSAGRVELALGTSSGSQTTLCGRVAGLSSGSLAVTLNEAPAVESQLACIIPPGSWAILRSVNEVNTPTYLITAQLEQAL